MREYNLPPNGARVAIKKGYGYTDDDRGAFLRAIDYLPGTVRATHRPSDVYIILDNGKRVHTSMVCCEFPPEKPVEWSPCYICNDTGFDPHGEGQKCPRCGF